MTLRGYARRWGMIRESVPEELMAGSVSSSRRSPDVGRDPAGMFRHLSTFPNHTPRRIATHRLSSGFGFSFLDHRTRVGNLPQAYFRKTSFLLPLPPKVPSRNGIWPSQRGHSEFPPSKGRTFTSVSLIPPLSSLFPLPSLCLPGQQYNPLIFPRQAPFLLLRRCKHESPPFSQKTLYIFSKRGQNRHYCSFTHPRGKANEREKRNKNNPSPKLTNKHSPPPQPQNNKTPDPFPQTKPPTPPRRNF